MIVASTIILTLLLIFRSAFAPGHTEVGVDVWKIPADGGPLPKRDFVVGEEVVFEWTGRHNVYIHPTGDCSEDGAIEVGTESGASYVFTEEDIGELTFACDVGMHCERGMIMKATVKDDPEHMHDEEEDDHHDDEDEDHHHD